MIWNSTRFLDALSSWFTATCLIEQNSSTGQSASGMPVANWTTLHADVPCSPPFAPNIKLAGQVQRTPAELYAVGVRQITLKGVYVDVSEGMRVTIENGAYLVEIAYTDSQQVFTVLLVREVDL